LDQTALSSRQIFWYAVPARTVTKKALIIIIIIINVSNECKCGKHKATNDAELLPKSG